MPNPTQSFDEIQREMYRKSMDTILVFNPTDEDYVCIWDKYPHVIPNHNKDMGFGMGKMQLPRYIADKYMKEMKDKIINREADSALDKEKKRREEKGLAVDPYEVNAAILNTAPRTNNEKEIEKAYGVLYAGLVREFGLYDEPVKETVLPLDTRTPEERAMDKVTSQKEIPKAENSVVSEPDDLTTGSVENYTTPNGLQVTYTKKVEPTKSRISGKL